jgi:RNA polymerase sigma-70 factor (ECF subfamily)
MVTEQRGARAFEEFYRDEYRRLVPMIAALLGDRADPPSDLLPDEAVWALVRALPDQQRRAVVLHYVGDLSVADVADVMECSEGTVKTHLSRARTHLAQRYATDAGGRDHA